MAVHPISRKILVPDLWTKMLSANEIAVFINQHYLKNELTDYPNNLTASDVKNSSQQLETITSVFCNKVMIENLALHNAEMKNVHFCSNFDQSCRKSGLIY